MYVSFLYENNTQRANIICFLHVHFYSKQLVVMVQTEFSRGIRYLLVQLMSSLYH